MPPYDTQQGDLGIIEDRSGYPQDCPISVGPSPGAFLSSHGATSKCQGTAYLHHHDCSSMSEAGSSERHVISLHRGPKGMQRQLS